MGFLPDARYSASNTIPADSWEVRSGVLLRAAALRRGVPVRRPTRPPPCPPMTTRPALLLGLPASLALALWLASASREEARLRANLVTMAGEAEAMDYD